MLEIFKFYINIVVKIFTDVMQHFEITNGVGYGTFLLAGGLLVVFINLLKFRFSSNGIAEIKSYRDKQVQNSSKNKFNNFSNSYMEKMGYTRRNN